jgi:hypothetical protein
VVCEPGPPSWHALLFAKAHVSVHHIGGGEGGGEGGGGEGGGGEGEGGGGDGGNTKRAPQSAQSVPHSHWTGVPNKSKSEPGPPSWHAPLLADAHESSHAMGEGVDEGGGGDGDGGGGDGGNM